MVYFVRIFGLSIFLCKFKAITLVNVSAKTLLLFFFVKGQTSQNGL